MKHIALLFVFFLMTMNAIAKSPPTNNRYNIRGFNPDYQYHGIQRGQGSIDWQRNETRQEYNRRCAYNPAVCVEGYKPYE